MKQFRIKIIRSCEFEIDMWAMKQDKYMPRVSIEEPIQEGKVRESIAWMLGLQDYNYSDELYGDGVWESTLVIFGWIPPKYIKIYKE